MSQEYQNMDTGKTGLGIYQNRVYYQIFIVLFVSFYRSNQWMRELGYRSQRRTIVCIGLDPLHSLRLKESVSLTSL